MRLIVGLGNPGEKYANNRHNAGFMAVERIVADHAGTPWRSKFHGMLSELRLPTGRIICLKPQTFMNKSGQSVHAAAQFYKCDPQDITVLHDELDLAPGKLRYKSGGGHAGHNGLRSVHEHIGPDYDRVRIGIGHPGHKNAVAGYVLRDFAKTDYSWLENILRGISDGAPWLIDGDGGRFMNAAAQHIAPPRSSARDEHTGAASKMSAATDHPVPDNRSAMQRLLDKFK